METAAKHLIRNTTEFVKHWSWKEVTIEADMLDSGESGEVVMGVSMKATNVWTPLLMRKTITVVVER